LSAVAVARGVRLEATLELEVSRPLVRVQDCAEMEAALRRSFDWSLERDETQAEALRRLHPARPHSSAADAALTLSEPQTIRFQVLERRLRFVLHNGRQLVAGVGGTVRLGERDRTAAESEGNQAPVTELFATKGSADHEDRHACVKLKGLCRHKHAALVVLLEYVVRPEQNGVRVPLLPGGEGSAGPQQSDEHLTAHAARVTVVVGAGHFLPFDGKRLRLRGTTDGRALDVPCDEKAGRFTLALQVDEAARALAAQLPSKPLVWPLPAADDLFDGQRLEDPDKPLKLVKFRCEAREADHGSEGGTFKAVADETPSDPADEAEESSGGEEKEGDDDDDASEASEGSDSAVESDSSQGSALKRASRRPTRRSQEKSPRRSSRTEQKEPAPSSPSSLDTAPSPDPSPRGRTHPAVSFDAPRDFFSDALADPGHSAAPRPSSLLAHTLSAPLLRDLGDRAFAPGVAASLGAALWGGPVGEPCGSLEGRPLEGRPFEGGVGDTFGASSGHPVSRASRARLGASHWGAPPEQLRPVAAAASSLDVAVEMADPRCRSVLTLRFAAYRSPDRASPLPAAISVSYRFFDRPPVRSGRLTLKLDVANARDGVSNATPRLLVSEGGASVGLAPDEKIVFDASAVTGGEAREVFEYLSCRTMFLDVWDGDSLLLLGTVALPLQQFLRQGRAVVQRAVEYDVVAAAGTDDAAATVTLHSSVPPVGRAVGLLQVATCCYGEQGLGDRPGAASHVPAPKLIPQGALVNWRLAAAATVDTPVAVGKQRPRVRKRSRRCSRSRSASGTAAAREASSTRGGCSNCSTCRPWPRPKQRWCAT
jgi:hypothetical protein